MTIAMLMTILKPMPREKIIFRKDMPEVKFYEPTVRGLEGKISERLAHLRELDKQAKKKS